MARTLFTITLAGAAIMAGLVGCTRAGQAVAVVQPTEGNQAHGVVEFTQTDAGVHIVADISGLTPNASHAFHVHDYGDLRDPAAKSAGGHYNPAHEQHGRPEDQHRHAGDLGNLHADGEGNAHYDRVDPRFTILGPTHPVIGRAVIIHAGADQFTQPTGGAGARIGAGVIGLAKPSP